MPDKNPNFLESIEFQEDFLPLKSGTEIQFGGEKEVQRMIEFYLKNKGKENYKKNSERFKINCILGNNGGGKSRLFERIYTTADYNYHILLDDFFSLSKNKKYSLHHNLFQGSSLNKLYINIITNFSILKKSKFISMEQQKNKLNIFCGSDSLKGDEKVYYTTTDLYNRGDENIILNILRKSDNINTEQKKYIISYFILIRLNQFIQIIIKEDSTLGLLKLDFDDIISDLEGIDLEFKYKTSQLVELLDIVYKQDNGKKFKKFLLALSNNNGNLINALSEQNNEKYIITFFQEIKTLTEDIKNINISIINESNFDDKSIIEALNSGLLHCNLYLGNETSGYKLLLDKMSAGEITNYIRNIQITINIFTEYLKESIGKTDFLILIDEPDLHLHLDWQRQYIQKLIDVFSTLDSEINLHFIIATHSPFIISDLPKESLVLLENGEQIEYEGETFGANYIDIIKNGFFFENKQMLMGSFAQENIQKASKKLKAKLYIDTIGINEKNFEEKKTFLNNILEEIGENKVYNFGDYVNNKKKYFDGVENIQDHIGDDFLQDNLMYLN